MATEHTELQCELRVEHVLQNATHSFIQRTTTQVTKHCCLKRTQIKYITT